jgi:glycosyltransferase involved in cell wall biosynthesis
MRLSIVTQYYPPEIGAPQARLSELASHFVKAGHSVTVLTAMPNYPLGRIYPGYGGLFRQEQKNGVKVIRTFIFPTQSAGLLPRLTNYFSFMFSSALFGSMFLPRSDYLLVESPPLFAGLPGVWLSKLKSARLIFNVSDLWPESAVRLGVLRAGSVACRVSARLESFCYQSAWLITGQSKTILENIRDRFPNRPTFHLSNGVDTDLFKPDRATAEAPAALEHDAKTVVLYAGLHGIAQGLEQLVEAAEVLRHDMGLRFMLVGDGPAKRSLFEGARERGLDNVRFEEPRPAGEIPALLAAADIIVVPLKMYIPGAVPSKLYEAMASGRPVVLIAEGEAAEIVRQHQAGIIVKPGDIRSLVCAIRTLQKQPSLRRTLGSNGRRAAKENFDRAAIARRFIERLEAAV